MNREMHLGTNVIDLGYELLFLHHEIKRFSVPPQKIPSRRPLNSPKNKL
ncbi:hypothetical protein XBJ1_2344 [Xenorhabdus bovienii SS-2004]|uniref:Uncharacterized protein n=1 Tax=Xenorhabdus bovienii (strain SS-2004) TaxID=406818 RepID=D3V1C6_XENBS|nr:hypothetical protein XBJ1_2344 [Xenorhabdus bovienii SS-2004]